MASGGLRRPTNPAPVSGPGALSARTDGKQPIMSLSDADYGEQATYRQQQQGAPLAQSSPIPSAPSGAGLGNGGPGVIPLTAPTQRPNEPVTAGAASGPGPGPEALGIKTMADQDYQQKLQSYMPVLNFMANLPGASASAKAVVMDLNSRV